MEQTRRDFLAGAGAVATGYVFGKGVADATGFARAAGVGLPERSEPEGPQGAERVPPKHDSNLIVFFSDIHQHDNTMR